MSKVLITGANGFVGSALCDRLDVLGIDTVRAVRRPGAPGEVGVGTLSAETNWMGALRGCSAVIHLAARVHVMNDGAGDPLAEYRLTNVEATLNLARQAAAAGVKRFVFVSSVKVNGESTGARPFAASDPPLPRDPYGQSKMEAEQALQALARETGLEVAIVRPPLVYGPGVKANFLSLMRLVSRGWPLPFGRVSGRRSMVALENLVDLLIVCMQHPRAPGGIFMVSDGTDLTVGEMVQAMAAAMDKRVLLLPVSPGLMRAAAGMLGKAAVADRLLGSLQVDIAPTRTRLEWEPAVKPEEAIAKTVAHFLAKGHANR